MDIGHVLFSLKGRIGQQDYWIGILIILGGNVLVGITGPFAPLFWLGLVWVGIAVFGKRLHDAGKTAWYHAFVWALSFVLGMIGAVIIGLSAISAGIVSEFGDFTLEQIIAFLSVGGFGLLLIGASYLVWIIYAIWLGFMPPDPGENQYGPPPGADAVTAQNYAAAASSTGKAPDKT
jgi:uncharacterized membrane protein YhaH (DUF805 family)